MSEFDKTNWLKYYHKLNHASLHLERLTNLRSDNEIKFTQKNQIEFIETLNSLPQINTETINFSTDSIIIGKEEDLKDNQKDIILSKAKELIPWRKGPFQLFDQHIDAEWRSDKKWKRLLPSIPNLKDKRVLDVGCNNGYFMFKMAAMEPELVLGIDPIVLNYAQFQFINHFANKKNLIF